MGKVAVPEPRTLGFVSLFLSLLVILLSFIPFSHSIPLFFGALILILSLTSFVISIVFYRKHTHKYLAIISIILACLCILFSLLAIYASYYLTPPLNTDIATNYATNELPFYGKTSFEEYFATRDETHKKLDDDFVTGILSKSNESTIIGSNGAISLGWAYLGKGDDKTAIKRFNQAGLIDSKNYNIYWGLGATLGVRNDLSGSLIMFQKAIDMYDQKYSIASWDIITLHCDYASSYFARYRSNNDSSDLDNTIRETDRGLALSNSDLEASGSKAQCHFRKSMGLYEKGLYQESWNEVQIAKELNPYVTGLSPSFYAEISKKVGSN